MAPILRLAWRLALLLVGYQIARMTFFVVNFQQFAGEPGLMRSFLHGIRFDLSAIITLNSIYILAILARLETILPRTLRWLFTITNTSFLLVNFADAEYFQFSGNRLTLNSFAIAQDISQQAVQILLYYWPVVILGVLLGWLLYWLHGEKHLFDGAAKPGLSKTILIYIFTLGLLVLAARGGTQAKPLSVGHGFLFSSAKHLALTLNSTFTIFKSYGNGGLDPLSIFESWDELKDQIQTDTKSQPQYTTTTNVVIIILESFGREYIGFNQEWEGYTPFLDELATRGVFFETAFMNGRRSIDALPSILAGVPSLMVSPLATSPYQTRDLVGLPAVLKKKGYDTAFFHGGHDGTMFFDVLAARLGFTNYFGATAFPDQTQDDGRWGIFDEPFLQWSAEKMGNLQEPFFSTIFSLTSHHPYKIPGQYQDTFTEGTLPIHRSIRYADYALKRFFETAKTQPWFDNTLFVITADHTSKGERLEFQQNIGQFRSPLLFFHPKNNPSFPNLGRLAQHVDIMPTLFSLLGVKPPAHARFGSSLLSGPNSQVVLFNHPYYWLVKDPFLLQATSTLETFEIYNWRDDPGLTSPLQDYETRQKEALRKQLLATLQYYRNGLIENRLNW